MLTPYDPNSSSYYNDNHPVDCTANKPEMTLKRTNSNELKREFSSFKKMKTGGNEEPVQEVSFRHLVHYVEVIYPHVLPDFNTCSALTDFSTAYHFAANEIDLELIKLLLAYGASVNGLDKKNENALMVACRVHRESCKLKGFIEQRSEDVIMQLLDARCNPLQKNTSGITPMHLIATSKSVKFFAKLKELGFDLNTPLNSLGDSPLTCVCNSFNKNSPQKVFEIVNELVDLGCDLMQKSKFDMPLEILVRDKLLNAQGYISLLDKIPEKHLPQACNILLSTDDCEVYKELFKRGVSFDTLDNKGKPPLYRAIEKLDATMITYLLNNGANYQQQRPAASIRIHLCEDSSPYELLDSKMKICSEMIVNILLQINKLQHLKASKELNFLMQQLNQHLARWKKIPFIFKDFLISSGNDGSKVKDYYNYMIPYLFKSYQIQLQFEQNKNTSNKVMELLNSFQILSKKILDKYEDESIPISKNEYEPEETERDLLDFLFHFSKFFYAILSLLSAKHDPKKICEQLSYLIELMENQFTTQNFDEVIENLEESSTEDTQEDTQEIEYSAHTPETDPLSEEFSEQNSEEYIDKYFTSQDESIEDVEYKCIKPRFGS